LTIRDKSHHLGTELAELALHNSENSF
jgi:hypothetical protein